ncbi:MAG: hypothetical protein J7J43_03425 [Thermosipho sp. (in: Bacteria)]|nr:hypothetical protein [Thermosipho sp. (in: thermotogales)]
MMKSQVEAINDVWKKWVDKKFSVSIAVDDYYDEYILFEGETWLNTTTVIFKNTTATRLKLLKAVQKAIKWSNIARKNHADTSKSLGCFVGYLGKYGEKNYMCLEFFSARGGEQTNLIITMMDCNNQFIKTTIYFDELAMKKMLITIKKIEGKFEEARKNVKKSRELFK